MARKYGSETASLPQVRRIAFVSLLILQYPRVLWPANRLAKRNQQPNPMSDSNDNLAAEKKLPRRRTKNRSVPLGHFAKLSGPGWPQGDHARRWLAGWQSLSRCDWRLRAIWPVPMMIFGVLMLSVWLRHFVHRRETVSRNQQTHQPGVGLGLADCRNAREPRLGHAAVLAGNGSNSAKFRDFRWRVRQLNLRGAFVRHRHSGGLGIRQRQHRHQGFRNQPQGNGCHRGVKLFWRGPLDGGRTGMGIFSPGSFPIRVYCLNRHQSSRDYRAIGNPDYWKEVILGSQRDRMATAANCSGHQYDLFAALLDASQGLG